MRCKSNRTLKRQNEVYRIHHTVRIRTVTVVCATRRARQVLPNRLSGQIPRNRLIPKRSGDPGSRGRLWSAVITAEIEHFTEPLHEIVREVEPAVVTSAAEQRGIFRSSVVLQHHCSIHPFSMRASPIQTEIGNQICLESLESSFGIDEPSLVIIGDLQLVQYIFESIVRRVSVVCLSDLCFSDVPQIQQFLILLGIFDQALGHLEPFLRLLHISEPMFRNSIPVFLHLISIMN